MKNLRFFDHGAAGNPRFFSGLRFYEGNVELRQLGILRFWRDLKVSEPVQLQIYSQESYGPTGWKSNKNISYINYTGWWFGTWSLFFPSYWECHVIPTDEITPIFFRGVGGSTTNQIPFVVFGWNIRLLVSLLKSLLVIALCCLLNPHVWWSFFQHVCSMFCWLIAGEIPCSYHLLLINVVRRERFGAMGIHIPY